MFLYNSQFGELLQSFHCDGGIIQMSQSMLRSFLKWPGGKFQILHHILERLPKGQQLIEPFVGSGVVGLNAEFDHYTFADVNPDLIGVYQCLQDSGAEFLKSCAALFKPKNNTPVAYYRLRDSFNASNDMWRRAALFVYLNRHGYNGLCRYNASGIYNVPFGRYRKPELPQAGLQRFIERAQRITVVCADFAAVMASATPGCVVYCDPPYVPLTKTAHFTKYATLAFDAAEQERLANSARALAKRRIPVLISNHDTPYTRDLYKGSEIESILVRRFISCQASNRMPAAELLALFAICPRT